MNLFILCVLLEFRLGIRGFVSLRVVVLSDLFIFLLQGCVYIWWFGSGLFWMP